MKKISKAIAWAVVIMFMLTIFAPAGVNAATKYGEFPDVEANHWAKQVVTKMSLTEIVVGYEEGDQLVFKPEQAVSKMEAVIMATRAMGIKSGDASKDTPLHFTVPQWAEGAAKAAVANGMISKDENFKGTEKASREWITRLLIRTVNKDDEKQLAKAQDEVLKFTDANTISKGFEPYVKLAVKTDLARGHADNTFGPKEAVTRAQMVAFLSRLEGDLKYQSNFVLIGDIIESKSEGNVIRISAQDGNQYELTYDAKTSIYNEDKKLIPGVDVKEDDFVYIIAKKNNIEYLEIRDKDAATADKDKKQDLEVEGKILSIDAKNTSIVVEIENEDEKNNLERYIIEDDTTLVNSQDETIVFEDLEISDKIHLSFSAKGALLKLERITGQEKVILKDGIVKDIDFENKIILIDEGGKTGIYKFDANTQVTIDSKVDVKMENLQKDDEVKFSSKASMLEAIALVNAGFDNIHEGIVENINDKVITYRTFEGALKSNYLDRNAKVLFGDGRGAVNDVRIGDSVEVKLMKDKAIEISLPNRNLVEKISGTAKVDYGADGIIVIVDRNNEDRVYEVDNNTDVRVDGYSNNLISIKKGMPLEVEAKGKQAIRIRANY